MPGESKLLKFGDYEADLRTGTLRNRGIPVRLQAQPFRILTLLVLNAGELVTREEICAQLWPAGTHVGFEIGLNRAVNRLRNALNDTAAAPKFIETIPGRGYRFISPVEMVDVGGKSKRKQISLGVLPFRNLTDDVALDYLCDGVTEDVSYELATARELHVMAPSTMFQYKDANPQSVANERKLDLILHGEVLKRGAELAIRAELVERGSSAMLWGTRLETSLDNMQSVRSDMAAQICRALSIDLPRRTVVRQASAKAYRAYLQGRFLWNRRTPEAIRESIASFQNAIGIDPEYALAYSGLADAYALLALSPYCAVAPRQSMPMARAAAERAVQLDAGLAEGHASLALVQFNYDWDFVRAESSFRRAIELGDNYPAVHHWYSLLLIASGQYEDARREAVMARDLDPMSATANALVGVSLYFGREPQAAADELRALVEVEPRSPLAWSFLGMACIGLKQLDRAESAFQRALEIFAENTTAWAGLGYVWACKGQKDRVQEIFTRIDKLETERYIPPQVRVFLHLGLGELERALDLLEKAYRERCDFLVYINVDPALDTLHGHPRFEELRKKIVHGSSGAGFADAGI